MTIGQLIDDIRGRYLAQFRERISDVEKAGMEAMRETAYRDEDGSLTRGGTLSLPLRLDIVGVADGEAKDTFGVDSKTMLSFEPIEFDWSGGMATRLAPFHWDACDIRVVGMSEVSDWSRVRNWFDQWFDGEDTHQPDEHGFYGVVHRLSDRESDGDATAFQVDFGSAPEAAFEDLLDALHDSGATRIEIGHALND